MTTYVDEDLLRSAKVLAARRDGKVYEILEEALRRYLDEEADAAPEPRKLSLAEAISRPKARRLPGVPRERAVELAGGETLSEAVISERESREY